MGTFKYPGRFATWARAVPLNEHLTTKELLRKVTLSTSQQPPDAKRLFELYYMEEIYPFISKHAQETVSTKKDIGKAWGFQKKDFQNIYEKRSELLKAKWLEMRGTNNSNSYKYEYQKYNKEKAELQEKQNGANNAVKESP